MTMNVQEPSFSSELVQVETPLPPESNRLLFELPNEVKLRIFPHLELVSLNLGDVICEAGSKQRYVYFPLDSIISLLYVMENGSSAEIAVVGNDGMVGVALFMGGQSTTSRAVEQLYRVRDRLIAYWVSDLKMNLIVTVLYFICYYVIVKYY